MPRRHKYTFNTGIFLTVVLVIATVFLLISISLVSLNHIINFNGYAANGAFQLMNPLTRLAAGEVLGRDLQFFHGAGVALIHYPFFMLFGQNLFGSEMSRWFTSILLFVVSTLFLCYAWFKTSKNRLSVGILAFALILLVSNFFAEVITPSNSLLGVRSTMPLIIAAIILLKDSIKAQWKIAKTKITIKLYDVLIGVTLALAVLLGTEHGIACILAYITIELSRAIVKNRVKKQPKSYIVAFKKFFIIILPVGIFGAASLLILATIISLGHPVQLLHYALITVPGDQFWYFGSEPQGYLTLRTLFAQLGHPTMYPLYIGLLITAISIFAAKRFKLFSSIQWMAGLFLVAYGIFTLSSFVGYFSPLAQIVGLLRVLIIFNALVLVCLIVKISQSKKHNLKYLPFIVGGIIAVALTVTAYNKIEPLPVKHLLKSTYQNVKGDHSSLLRGSAWEVFIGEFQPYIESAKQESSVPLWSTYASLYERENHLIHPSSKGFDYIIHALGDSREDYEKEFIEKKPELVTTLRPSYFGFEEWLWGRHATFYSHLVNNYSIVAENEAHILWKRDETSQTKPAQKLAINQDTNIISLPNSKDIGTQLVEVEVSYETSAPLGLSKVPRYMIKPSGTYSTIGFSMPPSSNTWKFLVVLKEDSDTAELNYYANGLIPGAKLKVTNATFTPVTIDSEEQKYFTEQSVFLKATPQ